MSNTFKMFRRNILGLAIAGLTASAWAVPVLQLDIQGGTYDMSTQSILTTSNTFSVFALGLVGSKVPLADTYYISISLIGVAQPGGTYGSFTVNGSTINATTDMIWGTPPVDSAMAEWDPGDLSSHGIFPAYFKEIAFNFSAAQQSAIYNSQDDAGSGPQTGTGLYYKQFDIDASGLATGSVLHFDLYSEKFSKGNEIDVNKFAPFSHDAEAHITTVVPEPETYAMLLAGLGLMGYMSRRRKIR